MSHLLAVLISATPRPLARGDGAVAALLQSRDTLTQHFVDSVVVKSPLPDPMVPIVQWIFQKPGWLIGSGIVLAVLGAGVLWVLLGPRRRAIWAWLTPRERGVKLGMAAAVAAVLLLIVGTSVK